MRKIIEYAIVAALAAGSTQAAAFFWGPPGAQAQTNVCGQSIASPCYVKVVDEVELDCGTAYNPCTVRIDDMPPVSVTLD
jgi:hypothetical protein